jgi:tRNA A37 threonylcarbamoyladenosine modification protein TsaB
MTAFDARRGQLYIQMFSIQMNGARDALTEPAALDVAQAAALLRSRDRAITLLGSGAEALTPHGPAGACILMPVRFPIAAAFLAPIARATPGTGMPRPLYLRPADTT